MVHEARLPSSNVPIYLIEHKNYFDRPNLYGDSGSDYGDNAERFAFFSRACLQLAKALHFAPDVVHCHDWQTALIPIFLKAFEADHPQLWSAASVLTLHNVGYQGVFPKDDLFHSQLGWQHFTPSGLEFHDQLNYLKGGIHYADKLNTVSPTYAQEIQTPAQGCGLEGVFKSRSADLIGILNGCNYREWNPADDRYLPAAFDVEKLAGKAECKRALQREFQLPIDPDKPLIAFVSRLAHQKGIDILSGAMHRIVELDAQLAILGSGETWAELFYGNLPVVYSGRVGAYIGFDMRKAHLCYAGADFFLMPSRYEPCGLAQLIAKRYGTLPIARATGGLVDTIDSYVEGSGDGDGFLFHDLTQNALYDTIAWAVSTYYDRKHHIAAMTDRAMRQRFDWTKAAHRYLELFTWAIERRRGL